MRKTRLIGLTILVVLFFVLTAVAETEIPRSFSQDDGVAKLRNSFIEILVNSSQDGAGRFAVLTTGGDPTRIDDDNNFLIYGLGKPVTSYTTIRIDKTDYVFGGKTTKRAGLNGQYGKEVTPPVFREDGIYAAYSYGDILVEQIIDITTSTTTGQSDTASISYVISNQGVASHQVGLRVVLDTMLGNNDGAPFRVRDMAVVSDTLFTGNEIPSFVQAFDDLVKPAVMAQGNLSGPEVTQPSRVYFTNWGSLADGVWDFNFQAGRDFTREGEFDLDSAMALFWDPATLLPGESRRFVTHYGLGGISIAQGYLSLGLSSVNKVEMAVNPVPFDVIGYVQNTGDGVAHEVVARLKLPQGLRIVDGKVEKFLSKMAPGESQQVVWKVIPTGDVFGEMEMKMDVEAVDVEVNSVSRKIEVTKPARLALSISGPRSLGIYEEKLFPGVFEVTGRITNDGGSTAHNVELSIATSAFKVIDLQKPTFYIGTLPPNSSKEVVWKIDTKPNKGLTYPFGKIGVTLQASSSNAEAPGKRELEIQVPQLNPKLWFRPVDDGPRVVNDNLIYSVELIASNVPALRTFNIEIEFDPSVTEYLGWRLGSRIITQEADQITRGSFVATDPFEANKNGKIVIDGQVLERGVLDGSLVELKFRIIDRGKIKLNIIKGVLSPTTKFSTDEFEVDLR